MYEALEKRWVRLERNNISGAGTLGAGFNAELDGVAFVQIAEAVSLDCRVMDKHVFLTIFRANETKALVAIEKFNSTTNAVVHVRLLVSTVE